MFVVVYFKGHIYMLKVFLPSDRLGALFGQGFAERLLRLWLLCWSLLQSLLWLKSLLDVILVV